MKTDNVVFAHTRTVKRILDHVKVEGAVNLSEDARRKIYSDPRVHSSINNINHDHLGPMITKLKDEHDERTRELVQKSSKLLRVSLYYSIHFIQRCLGWIGKKELWSFLAVSVIEYESKKRGSRQ